MTQQKESDADLNLNEKGRKGFQKANKYRKLRAEDDAEEKHNRKQIGHWRQYRFKKNGLTFKKWKKYYGQSLEGWNEANGDINQHINVMFKRENAKKMKNRKGTKVKYIQNARNKYVKPLKPVHRHSMNPEYPNCNENTLQGVECTPDNCERSDCNNRFLHDPQSVSRFQTSHTGYGLKANRNWNKGDYVISYYGEIINKKEMDKRHTKLLEKGDMDTYFMKMRVGWRNKYVYIDAKTTGNMARYINHSCKSTGNLECRSYIDSMLLDCVGFWATKRIRKGDELLFDYGDSFFAIGFPCLCEACRDR
eukprot:976638_1